MSKYVHVKCPLNINSNVITDFLHYNVSYEGPSEDKVRGLEL